MGKLFDELDLRILDRLQADGRKPFTQIAQELGVSEGTVRSRVGRLTRRRMVKFVADVDPNELGLVYVYAGLRVQGPALKRAVEAVVAIPEAIYVVLCTGTFDVMLELMCRSNDDLVRLLHEIRSIPGVSHVAIMTILGIEKDEWRYTALASEAAPLKE